MTPAWLPHDLTLAHPQALYLLALPAIVLAWGLVNARELRRIFAPLIRAIVLALFVLAFASPERVTRSEGAARPAVVDASASITPAMRAWTVTLLRDQLGLRGGDPAFMFANTVAHDSISSVENALVRGAGCNACEPTATNLETALYRLASDPDAHGGPAVLVTDGWQNRGDAERAISAILSAEIRLDIFTPPGARSIPNVVMTELALPPALEKAEPFELGVTMENLNDAPVTGKVTISRDGAPIAERKVTLHPGSERLDFPVRTETAGLASYSAAFKPDNAAFDAYFQDDSLKGWVGVGARRKILILTGSAKDANYLSTVVQRSGLEPTIVPLASGEWNGSLAGYDAILINNVPSERIAPAAQNALAAYVDRGGSLAMIGGDSSFGLGGYATSPLAAVMPVTMKPPQHKEKERALILLIDKSGSMGRNDKLTYAKAAALTVTKSIKDSDLIGVIGFDSQPFVVVPLQSMGKNRAVFDQMVSRLSAHGTTFLIPALRETERTLGGSGAQSKHVVILTDGETGGTAEMYYDLVSRMHHDLGATISTVAVGREANVDLLQSIAKYGGGAYYQTDSPKNLPQLFVQDFRAHGGEVTMVEKEFTPRTEKPDPILKDLAGQQMPPLKGYVSTEIKPRATMSMFVDRAGTQEPLIASWKYGAGKALAVTTDASGRWSGTWVSGNVFQPVWNRLLGWMTPQTVAEPKIDVALGYQAGRINIKLTDYGAEAASASHLATVLVIRPDNSKSESALTEQVPGEFAGSIDAPMPGNYYFEVRSPIGKDKKFPPLAYTVSPAVNAELPRPEPNYGLLEHLASATGGRLNPTAAEVAMARPTVERRESVNRFLIIAAMILLIGEALVRRLTA
ncbi:MAG: VWA domain-containing protein [Candidatus Binatus sp.]|uniref:VWA domain-containing protein n=1 Tax=Candidatus Binatus sp. TaxID=2811406 RepID=UPI0027279190|nr:VWA domain-containing protein [Candidatus Binatus sp.]MDO8431307.1 VWA domain-containing protein [Candidatus Binatus sp.]